MINPVKVPSNPLASASSGPIPQMTNSMCGDAAPHIDTKP